MADACRADVPWRDLPKKTRNWILFTEEQPRVPVYAGFNLKEARQAIEQLKSDLVKSQSINLRLAKENEQLTARLKKASQ